VAQYLVELYVARRGAGGLQAAVARARAAAERPSADGVAVRCVRSIFVPEEETWLLLYEGPSIGAVEAAVARAGLHGARVVEAVMQT
jgi:hypothetical protein